MAIWVKSPIPVHFSSLIPKMSMFTLAILFLLDHLQFTLIHVPNIPGSYAILFFIALDFTFTTRHIHSWVLFPFWPSLFILSGAISNCPLLLPSSILDSFWSGGAHLLVSYVFAFYYHSWSSRGKNIGVGCHSSSSRPRFVRTLHLVLFVLVGPTWHGS